MFRNLDEDVCCSMVAVAQCCLVVQECAAMELKRFILIPKTSSDISKRVKESASSTAKDQPKQTRVDMRRLT